MKDITQIIQTLILGLNIKMNRAMVYQSVLLLRVRVSFCLQIFHSSPALYRHININVIWILSSCTGMTQQMYGNCLLITTKSSSTTELHPALFRLYPNRTNLESLR